MVDMWRIVDVIDWGGDVVFYLGVFEFFGELLVQF